MAKKLMWRAAGVHGEKVDVTGVQDVHGEKVDESAVTGNAACVVCCCGICVCRQGQYMWYI